MTLQPAGATAAGAGWRIAGRDVGFRSSGATFTSPTATITVEFAAAAAYVTPAPRELSVQGGTASGITITYARLPDPEKPVLSQVGLTGDRKLRLSIGAPASGTIVIETTENFTRWDPVHTNQVPFVFETEAQSAATRFFRAKAQSP